MPIDNRDWYTGRHPSSCTCVQCTNRRLRRLRKEAHPSYIYICPRCNKKSLFYNGRDRIYECLNLRCKASGRTLYELRGHGSGIYMTTEETNRAAAWATETQRKVSYRKNIPVSYKTKPTKSRRGWSIPILFFSILLILFGVYRWGNTSNVVSPPAIEIPPIQEVMPPTLSPVTPAPPAAGVVPPSAVAPPATMLPAQPTLRNPSWEELKTFLWNDKTDQLTYIYPTFVCGDFAKMLQGNAKEAGWRCAFVEVGLSGYPDWYHYGIPSNTGHGLNAFETTDRGLVYIDCAGLPSNVPNPGNCDKIVGVAVGKEYIPISIFPEYNWGSWFNCGTITSVSNLSW